MAQPLPRKFRLRAKTYFLTFPQNTTAAQEVATRIRSKYGPDLEWFIVAQEEHKDGEPHLHVLLRFKAEKSVSNAREFDALADKHPNIVCPRNLSATVRYVTKDGKYEAEGIDVSAYVKAGKDHRSSRAAIVAEKLRNGTDLATLLDEDAGYVLQNLRKIREFQHLVQEQELLKKLKTSRPFSLRLTNCDGSFWQIDIGQQRQSGDPHYWIVGPTGVGKTTRVLDPLRSEGAGFCMPYNNDWTGYSDHYQFIYADEFKGQCTSFTLNQVCDGGLCKLNTKGGTVVKKKPLPVIIVSNFEPKDVYKCPIIVSTIERRFTVVYLREDFASRIVYGEDVPTAPCSPELSTPTQ